MEDEDYGMGSDHPLIDDAEYEEPVLEVTPEIVPEVTKNTPISKMENLVAFTGDIDIDKITEQAKKYMAVEKQLRNIAISVTNKHDWVDEGGKPYLMWSGAARVARALGVSFKNIQHEESLLQDEKGEFLICNITGDVHWKGDVISEMGSSHSRKVFFAKRFDKQKQEYYLLPLSEIDRCDIKKMAHTNFLNRGLRSMVGLNFTWEEVEASLGISKSEITGKVAFKKETKDIESPKRKEIITMLKEMHGENARMTLEALTTFRGKDGTTVKGKNQLKDCSDKQVDMIYPKIKEQYEQHLAKAKA